jgi:hypothetical protein
MGSVTTGTQRADLLMRRAAEKLSHTKIGELQKL